MGVGAQRCGLNKSTEGTRAVLVGDRVAPENLEIKNGVVIASYADRGFSEPMSRPPSMRKTTYLVLESPGLGAVTPASSGEQILQGWFVTGHEVRSFRPCSKEEDVWLMGSSPALSELFAAHQAALSNARPYMPLFVTVAGRLVETSSEGFGSDYDEGLIATRLVQVWPQGNCKSDRIILDSPLPGAVLRSPLTIRGRAKGNWFFEGDFPLLLLDASQNLLAQGYATAQSDWMTQGFVRFEGTLVFEPPPTVTRGVLVLKKDNPTGNPRFDDALKLAVGFE